MVTLNCAFLLEYSREEYAHYDKDWDILEKHRSFQIQVVDLNFNDGEFTKDLIEVADKGEVLK